ncbi:MAG: MBL fold metallo-hydrolase [Bacteroidales bacterium]|nr:MBL fold metallo-hydrolase [Bacteroidales bacterium]
MKTFHFISIIALTLCISSCSTRLESDVEVGPYTVSNISEGVWHIQDFNAANPAGETFDENGVKTHFNNCSDIYLIEGETSALLIDLSNRLEDIDAASASLRTIVSERIADKPLTITFTHNHGDHTGMYPAFKDDSNVFFSFPATDFRRMISRMPDMTEGRYEFFQEGKIYDLGGVQVEAVMVPGHTDGSMVFFLKGRDIVFTGDAIGSGHGVWIFNTDAFDNYYFAVPHLIDYINDPANGIDKSKLKIYGGHYWQRDWLDLKKNEELGYEYIEQMNQLLDQIVAGTAATEPSGLDRPDLDTYFRNGNAIITWNASQAEEYAKKYSEPIVYRGADVVFRQIDEHTWEGNGHMVYHESVYIVEGEDRAVLIDAGTNIRNLDKIVAGITSKPVTLMATHVHGDHTGSAVALFPELWINPADTVQFSRQPAPVPVKFLQDGEIIDLGGRTLEVMFTPGHTPGSVTFFDKEHSYGFSGDAFGSTNLLLTCGFKTLLETTTKAAEYMQENGIVKLYPGHYHGDNPETLQRVLDEKKMSEEMLSGKRKGVTEEGMLGLNSQITDFGVTIRYNYPDGLK